MNNADNVEVTRGLAEWIFKPIAERRQKFSGDLAGFCALRGSGYQSGLMVVGRAVNGWVEKLPKEPPDGEDWEPLARKLSAISMSWVTRCWESQTDYNTRRSAFWRVIRRVSLELVDGATEDDWPHHLVWSNLYKLAPWDGGNPPAALQHAQRDGCKRLLELEIKTFRPDRVLLLTGWNWADKFFTAPPEARKLAGAQFVEKVWDRPLASEPGSPVCRFVVAAHPQGKSEGRWTHEVLQAFR